MYQSREELIRLSNNRLLIAGITINDEDPEPSFLIISYPYEIIFDESNHMYMKNWMPGSASGMCDIYVDMIVAHSEPDDETLRKYHETIYDLKNMGNIVVTKIKSKH